jgi:type III restriction enzyme
MASHVNNISSRLSLRTPQRQSLDILHQVMELAKPHKNPDLSDSLSAIRSGFNSIEDFETSFPSLCFALATGVGKTRLMGAFITYLFVAHGIRHFFVLAPNLTIYKKLITDFTPNSPKYVFKGISQFAIKPPTLVTGENYEIPLQIEMDRAGFDDVVISLFNIAKFNTRSPEMRKVWEPSEYLGHSYFEYLSRLDDLIMIMDEAHRYRASASMKAIEALKPVMGLELTATPQLERGNSVVRFKNVIYDYPLASAMKDGYVKEPAVATRQDFNAAGMAPAALERLKLEDGIRIHEATKVELEVYAQQNAVSAVKPFLLVIARDTSHAAEIVNLIEDETFFNGHYRGRVIQVHSGQRGAEKDENVERLLAVERADEPTEIVVHVNMLKEGWDVTNLYTIVPLRAADSRTLVEQSIGRGLRLPYGRRTGVAAVDRLTIVAHDRFQDIVDEANRGGYTFNVVTIGKDIPEKPTKTIVVNPNFAGILGLPSDSERGSAETISHPEDTKPSDGAVQAANEPKPRFTDPAEQRTAQLAMDAIRKVCRVSKSVPGPVALASAGVQQAIIQEVQARLNNGQLELLPGVDPTKIEAVVKETTEVYIQHTIAIPRVLVLPQGTVTAGFNPFQLDIANVNLQPVSQDILIKHLASDTRETISALEGGYEEERLEGYIVRGLIDFDDVNYDEQADLLYDLSSQFTAHLRSYLQEDSKIKNVLQFHQRRICLLIHEQMQKHTWEQASSYEVVVSQGFSEVRPQAFAAPADAEVRDHKIPIEDKSNIRNMLFGFFDKCIYPTQKFDSDPERRFASLLERDVTVEKWFKPGKGVFQIRYGRDSNYEPDFVVETETEKLLCEPKRDDQLNDATVLAKARAAALWCSHASKHERAHGGKPWRYLLIPHDVIADNMTIDGLITAHTFADQPD